MQPKGRRPTANKKRRAAHAASLRKYTEEERRERLKKHHAPVERERFKEVMRRLLMEPTAGKAGKDRAKR